MTDVITCPSGLQGRVRGLKIADLNIFAEAADMGAAKIAEVFDRILTDCWVETIDPGPCASMFMESNGVKINWVKALAVDRFYALVEIRKRTKSLGPTYTFKHRCLDCGRNGDIEVDLTNLDVATMSDDATTKLARGVNEFEAAFSDGTPFTFRVFTGRDEREVAKLARKNKKMRVSAGLTYRIESMTVGGTKKTNKNELRKLLDELDDDELQVVSEAVDLVEGGIDNLIEWECDSCGSDRDATIPFGGGFWTPVKTAKRRRASTRFSEE